MSGQLTVREATEADVPAILDIYNHFILNSTATFDVDPQTLEERLHWLRDASDPYCAFVADSGGDLAGFGSLGPFRSKAAYRYTTENSVYVRPERHGEGIGKLLLTRTVEIAKENGFRAIIARRQPGQCPASRALRVPARGHGAGSRLQVRAMDRCRCDAAHTCRLRHLIK